MFERMKWFRRKDNPAVMETPAPERPRVDPRHPRTPGTPVVLADGQTWYLAAYMPDLNDRVWDRLFDQNVAIGKYQVTDVRGAASRLLLESYSLSPDQAVALVMEADPESLKKAVENALFRGASGDLTLTQWLRYSLLAAGLDPEEIPPADRFGVVQELVACRRARPLEKAAVVCRIKAEMTQL